MTLGNCSFQLIDSFSSLQLSHTIYDMVHEQTDIINKDQVVLTNGVKLHALNVLRTYCWIEQALQCTAFVHKGSAADYMGKRSAASRAVRVGLRLKLQKLALLSCHQWLWVWGPNCLAVTMAKEQHWAVSAELPQPGLLGCQPP